MQNNNFAYSNTVGKIYFILGGFAYDINGATCQPNSPVCTITQSVYLDTLVYNWSAYIDRSIDTVNTFAGIYISIQYQETQQVYNLLQNNSYISPASGLRIQSVTNYSNSNTIASEKLYSYNYAQDKTGSGNPQQYSYGRLMSIPSYARYHITRIPNAGYCTALELFSSSLTSLSSVIQGNIVGYDQETETSIDPSSGRDIGKTIYTFYNSPDSAIDYGQYGIQGVLNLGNNLNGLVRTKTDYSDISGVYYKVSETDNYYHTANRILYFSPKYQYYQGSGNLAYCANNTYVQRQTNAWFYPSIKSERVLLDSTYTYSYDQNTPANYLLAINRNYYDNLGHYQVTRQQTVDSKGNKIVSKLKYPQDYIPNGQTWTGNTVIDTMINRNMVSVVIEKQDSLYYNGSQSGNVTGAQLSLFRLNSGTNRIVPDKDYELSIQSPVNNFQPFSFTNNSLNVESRYRQMVSFDSYDARNNLQQYTATDLLPVSFIWDYQNKYPIAQAKNAVLANVGATSFEADGKGGWTFNGAPVADGSSPTGSYCYQLTSGSISKSGLTSSITYVVSFWSKTGASVSVSGGTVGSKQGKTIGSWTFYEDTLKGASTVTVSGSGYIDELRLYPVNAQMITYTYSPLFGITTQCDADNRINYYFYDGLGRLKWIKDQDGNIIKTFQ